MPGTQIIIVTDMQDSHADEIILALRAMKYDPIRLNTDEIPKNITMSFEMYNKTWKGTFNHTINNRTIDIENIRSIWWRRPGTFLLPDELSEQEREFAKKEIGYVFDSVWRLVDCYWVSFPPDIRKANFKMHQLQRAAEFGFEVPRTLVTSNKEDLLSFYELCERRIIFKVLFDPFLAQNTVPPQNAPILQTYTTLITDKELAQIDSIALAPCQFQELIPKRLELRVTIIGDEVFAAEIHSQTHEKTTLDWRHYDIELPYRKAQLPIDVEEKCLKLVKSYNLNFSAIDLILTPDDCYVFLENNPNGQFMFVEQHVPELKMTAALAACLNTWIELLTFADLLHTLGPKTVTALANPSISNYLQELELLHGCPAILFHANIDDHAIEILYQCLKKQKTMNKLDIVLVTKGGEVNAVRRMAKLLYSYTHKLTILVPSKAVSSGTLLCLSANNLIMGPLAQLSPIDVTIATSGPPSSETTSAISVENIRAFLGMAENWFDIKREKDGIQLFSLLNQRIPPNILGAFYRSDCLIGQIAEELFKYQRPES